MLIHSSLSDLRVIRINDRDTFEEPYFLTTLERKVKSRKDTIDYNYVVAVVSIRCNSNSSFCGYFKNDKEGRVSILFLLAFLVSFALCNCITNLYYVAILVVPGLHDSVCPPWQIK